MKILIVDDHSGMLHATRDEVSCIFGIDERNIDTAMNGQAGLEKARDAHTSGAAYDLIFTDYNMPKMNGGDMIREIRKLGGPQPLITLLSGNELSDVETGADFIFDKDGSSFENIQAVKAAFEARVSSANQAQRPTGLECG